MRRLHSPEDTEGIVDEALRGIIQQRFAELAEDGEPFDDLAEFWLVEPGDTAEGLEAATGLPIGQGWCCAARYPDPDFAPAWEVLEAHTSAYEMVFVSSDFGYATVFWIPKEGADQTLLAMCAEYATPALQTEGSAEATT